MSADTIYTKNEDLVRELWKCFHELRFDDAKNLFHKDFAAEWPQSGERFRGAENFVEMNRAYPGKFSINVLRTWNCGKSVVSEVFIKPKQGAPLFAISFYEFSEGRISKAVEYWSDTYEAPVWRAKWAEKF